MCAMLAMVIPKELGIARWRTIFFLESYLGWSFLLHLDTSSRIAGLLTRLQLHVPAAKIRKNVDLEEIKSSGLVRHRRFTLNQYPEPFLSSQLSTTIYTQCGLCRRGIVVPSGKRRVDRPSGGFGYCLKCRTNIARCAIW